MGCGRGRALGRMALDVGPDTRKFQQHHDHSDKEVDGAERFGARWHGQRQAALPGAGGEDLLVLEDEIGDLTVKDGDEQAHDQPSEFQEHTAIVERAGATHNQAKSLAGAGVRRFLYNRNRPISSGFLCILTSRNYWLCKTLTAKSRGCTRKLPRFRGGSRRSRRSWPAPMPESRRPKPP